VLDEACGAVVEPMTYAWRMVSFPSLARGVVVAVVLSLPAAAQPMLNTPLTPACISSPFGARGPGGPRASLVHSGMDIPAPPGAWVRAAAAGRIAWVRRRGAAGLEVEVVHAGGLTTRYAHLGTVAPTIASGRREVAQGEALGRVGRTGVTYGTHLHFEALLNGTRVNPASLLPLPPCRPRS
jgi:murein DD-endopeptidase MepM/ murein hydrolase activator NlpD